MSAPESSKLPLLALPHQGWPKNPPAGKPGAENGHSGFDDLPMIQLRPAPVLEGHPEHPDFAGYE